MKIIEQCKKAMYDAIWLEIDRNPKRPESARVDIKTKDGDICVWCHPDCNVAVVTHHIGNNDSVRLEEAIEECVDYQDVYNDYIKECPSSVEEEDLADRYDEQRLDRLMEELAGE